MKKIYILFFMATLAMGCAKEQMSDEAQIVNQPTYILKSEMAHIQELAGVVPSVCGNNVATKGSGASVISDIVPFGELMLARAQQPVARANSLQRTMSSEASATALDTSAVRGIYVVNYGDEEGFAVITSRPELASTLIYAPTGSLTENAIVNPGIEFLLDRIPEYGNSLVDSFPPDGCEYLLRPELTENELTKGPYLTTEWDQGYPFNSELDDSNCYSEFDIILNGHYPVGCVATAMAQIMVFHGFPSTVGGVTQNWNNYRTYRLGFDVDSDDIYPLGVLFETIGADVDMGYSCLGSGANSGCVSDVLIDNYDYLTGGYINYSLDECMTSINNDRPVYMRGSGSDGGHAWVMDGYYIDNEYYDVWNIWTDGSGNVIEREYSGQEVRNAYRVHFNYGWGDNSEAIVSSELLGITGDEAYFTSGLRIIPDIRPDRSVIKPITNNRITLSGSAPFWTISSTYPVTTSVSVGCFAMDTLANVMFTLPSGASTVTVESNYALEYISEVYPESDNTYHYTY